MKINLIIGTALAAVLVACGPGETDADRARDISPAARDSISREQQDSINRTLPGYVVDSIRPIEVELERFRAAIGGAEAEHLEGGETSRTALVNAFVKALAADDTAQLQSFAITAREFADLIYPESPYPLPPYRQPPGLAWSQLQQASGSGFTRLVRRMGGRPLDVGVSSCTRSEKQGMNTIWSDCNIQLADRGEERRARQLFGGIVERGGRFKILSFANEF